MTISTTKPKFFTFPNILTLLRIIAAAGVFFSLLFLSRSLAYYVALICFLFASITDYLDGFIARRFNVESALGKMLDPIADKVLIVLTGAALMTVSTADLGYVDITIAVAMSLILFREIFISGLREYLGNDLPLPVSLLAKWKTALQMIGFSLLMIEGIALHAYIMRLEGMNADIANQIIRGEIEDHIGLNFAKAFLEWNYIAARVLLGVAALATVVTGVQYSIQAIRFIIKEQR